MLLSEYYSESKYSENGKNYEVIVAGKNQRDYFEVVCTVCGEHARVVAASILSGRKPCLCSRKAFKTSDSKLKRVLAKIKDKNLNILQDFIGKAKDPLKVECLICGKIWNSTYNSLGIKGSGCPSCNNSEKHPRDVVISQINNMINPEMYRLVSLDYTDKGPKSDMRVEVFCKTCDQSWNTSVASILQGRNCPKCGKYGFQKDRSAVLYLLRIISEEQTLIGYKFGITCDLDRRVTQLNNSARDLGIHMEASYLWKYGEGDNAFEHEKQLKRKFNSKFQKFELPSGFSESIDLYELGEFIDYQTKQYQELLWQNTD